MTPVVPPTVDHLAQFLDILKIILGPIAGFIAAYYFNIELTKRRERNKLSMIKHIYKNLIADIESNLITHLTDFSEQIPNLDSWADALEEGLLKKSDENGNITIITDAYNIDSKIDYKTFDGVFWIHVYSFNKISIASELLKLDFSKDIDYEFIYLCVSLENILDSYSKSYQKFISELDNLRKITISLADGQKTISQLDSDLKVRHEMTAGFRRTAVYAVSCSKDVELLGTIIEKIKSFLS